MLCLPLCGHPVHIEIAKEEQVLIVRAECDLEHVLIQLPVVLPPLILGVPHLVPAHPGDGLQGDAGDGPCQEGHRVEVVLVVPEGTRGELEPTRDEVLLHTRLETVKLPLTQGRVMRVNE